ncbi:MULTISPECIES: hypothetical protein [Micrococcaceae]|uniref:hypothetical protein n=1 Tax=Micrococcaceae TaxID=1268 RepID=UPI00147351F8|nr:hypothetical protein [Arthrobacter sp. SF27]NMR32407.1 hypothetical protein [Arthrobacter sp. SF27]
MRKVENGETVQVGSSCIKDFTGWAAKPVFISVVNLTEDLGGFIGGFALAPEDTPETVVALAWATSRIYGWAAAPPHPTPTAQSVAQLHDGGPAHE